MRRWLIWLCALSMGLAPIALSQSSTQTGQQSTTTTDTAGGGGLPAQTGQSGKYLTTNGTAASWGAVTASVSYTCTPPLLCAASTISLAAVPTDQGAANIAIDLSNSNGAFVTNLTIDGTYTGALVGNASTATALAANPTDCSAGQYANAIAASGNLTCGGVTGAQVTNTPAGTLAATDAQAALNELDTEKAALASPTFTGQVNAPTYSSGPVLAADTAPTVGIVKGQSAWSQSTVNMTGANLTLAGGMGRRAITFVTPNSTGGTTVTFTANGTATVLTEGVNYNCNTLTTTQCATNLAAAIVANGTLTALMTPTASAAIVYLDPKARLYSLVIAAFAGAAITWTPTTDGSILLANALTSPNNIVNVTGTVSASVDVISGANIHSSASAQTIIGNSTTGYVSLWVAGAESAQFPLVGGVRTRNYSIPLVADATVQIGQVAMPDAGTDGRFDINTGIATTAIGVLAGTGASAAGTTYGIVTSGIAYVTPATGQTVTRQHFLCQSATAGVVDDSALLCTAGLGIGMALYSETADVLVSATASTNVIVLTSAPGWAVNDPVVFYTAAGAAIAGMTTGNVYWIKTITSADVTLSATKGGAVLDITADGTITTQYLQRLPQSVVHLQ